MTYNDATQTRGAKSKGLELQSYTHRHKETKKQIREEKTASSGGADKDPEKQDSA